MLPGDMYSTYSLNPQEYIGVLDGNREEAIDLLKEKGYKYNLIGAKKLHPDTGDSDDGSYRLLDPTDRSKQWHVHIWETNEGIEIFSHYEYKPEPWSPLDLDRSFEHYRPDYGETYFQGQHSEGVKEILEDNGKYEGESSKLGSRSLEPPTRS